MDGEFGESLGDDEPKRPGTGRNPSPMRERSERPPPELQTTAAEPETAFIWGKNHGRESFRRTGSCTQYG